MQNQLINNMHMRNDMKTNSSNAAMWGLIILGLMGVWPTVWGQSSTNIGLPKPQDVPNLIAVVQKPDASQSDKARACQQLAIVGGKDAVAALAALLADEQLSNYGRCGLEEIPDAAAGDALREAMGKLQGKFLVGVVNSIGVRRDVKAVGGLTELVRNPSRGAAPEALLALGRIATPEAIEFLQQTLASGSAELRPAAAEGCILVAEKQLVLGQRDLAMKLYDAVGKTDVPKPLHLAALRGSILSRQTAGLPLLLDNLRSDDPAILDVALRTARELPGPEVTQALSGLLPTARPAVQVSLLKVLVDRNDPSVCPAIEALAASDSPQVRVAVMQALGKIGGSSSAAILLKSIESNKSADETDAAAEGLTRLSAKDTDAAILKAVPSASPEVRSRLIAILGFRGATIAAGELLKQAGDANPAVSKAAFVALASVAAVSDLPELIRLTLACKDDATREKAERTVAGIAAKNPDTAHRSDLLVAAVGQATDPKAKCSLLRILAMIGDPVACNQILSAYKNPDAQVRETSFRILIDWPDAMPAPLLLEIFKTSSDKVSRTLALRGLVRMAALESNRQARFQEQAILWLTDANREIRDSVDEKRLILSGLGGINGLEGLRLLRPYLDDSAVQKEAAIAVIQTTKKLTSPQDRLMAKSLLESILSISKDPGVLNQAKELIRQIPGKSIELEVNTKDN
jgi:HEAT repeat protein